MSYCTAGHANHQASDIDSTTAFSVSELCSLIDDLIECWKDIVGKLDLRNGFHALGRGTNGKAGNSLLGQGCIEDSFRAKLGLKIHRAPEDTTECYIFAKEHDLIRGR